MEDPVLLIPRRLGTSLGTSLGTGPGTPRPQHVLAVHLPERVGDELDPGAVGVPEAHRDAAVHHVLDTGVGELGDQRLPALRLDADGHVVQAAEHRGGPGSRPAR
jgi:hypothetical protein